MPKSLRLAKDGSLALLEADVERTITDFLNAEQWITFPTKAEARMPSGAPAYQRGTLDMLAVRVHQFREQVLFCEFKARHARTKKKHLAEQSAMVGWLRDEGLIVFRASENCDAPIEEFINFYRENFA